MRPTWGPCGGNGVSSNKEPALRLPPRRTGPRLTEFTARQETLTPGQVPGGRVCATGEIQPRDTARAHVTSHMSVSQTSFHSRCPATGFGFGETGVKSTSNWESSHVLPSPPSPERPTRQKARGLPEVGHTPLRRLGTWRRIACVAGCVCLGTKASGRSTPGLLVPGTRCQRNRLPAGPAHGCRGARRAQARRRHGALATDLEPPMATQTILCG